MIQWYTPGGKESQTYYLSAELQEGLRMSPAVVAVGDSVLETGTNATTVVAGRGFQPRGADTEVQMLGLAFFTEGKMALLKELGFIAPWGNYLEPDVQACRILPTFFTEAPHLLERAIIVWDTGRWIAYMQRRNPGVRIARQTAPMQDGDVVGRYSVARWQEIQGLFLPKQWTIERFAVVTSSHYRLEVAVFTAETLSVFEGVSSAPALPIGAEVYDYRPSCKTNVELLVTYVTTNGNLLDDSSPLFHKMTARRVGDLDAAWIQRWRHQYDPKYQPHWRARAIVRIGLFGIIALPLLLLTMKRLRRSRSRPTTMNTAGAISQTNER
jgi:hypothetical protein